MHLLFRAYGKRLLKLAGAIPHQISLEAVYESSCNGCSICSHLWEQALSDRLDLSFSTRSQIATYKEDFGATGDVREGFVENAQV